MDLTKNFTGTGMHIQKGLTRTELQQANGFPIIPIPKFCITITSLKEIIMAGRPIMIYSGKHGTKCITIKEPFFGNNFLIPWV